MSTIDKKGFDEYEKKVQQEIEMFFRKVLEKIKSDAVRIIDQNKKVAWGELRRNIRSEVYREAGKMVGIVGVGDNVRSPGSKFPYAIAVHEGTKPHWPPQLAIQQWVIKKGIIKMNSRPITPGKLRGAKKRVTDPLIQEIKQISFLIARKISKSGTKGVPFLRMALNQNIAWVASELGKLKVS